MIGIRRAWRPIASVLPAIAVLAIVAGAGMAQDTAGSLSASFRRATARARGSLVSVRVPEGFPASAPYVPARPGRLGPMPIMPPPFDRAVAADGESRMPFSGLVVDADKGWILTVDQPVLVASQLVVTFPDGRERLTTQIRRDPRSGLTLLAIDVQGLQLSPVKWGDPARLEPGDWVIALGQPGVGDPSMSAGVFSTRRRGWGEEWLETDAAITRVGAGGALINLDGEVVGICRIGRRHDGIEGMGHAIPSDRARRVVDDLGRFGQVRRAYLGINVEPVDASASIRRGPASGVRVVSVRPGSPAAEARLQQDDIILAVGRHPVDSVASVQEAVESAPIGEELTLTVERQGRRMEIKVRPQALPGSIGPMRSPRPGTTLEPGRDPAQVEPGLPGRTPGLEPPGGPLLSPPSTGGPPVPPEP